MTLIFEYSTTENKPKTHVFIIGVGDYAYLIGGNNQKRFNDELRLGQLSPPPISAREVADWMIKNLEHPGARLGSIEMLLSSSERSYMRPTGSNVANVDNVSTRNPIDVDTATIDHMYRAFNAWHERCNSNKDNVAIFYCCSHGVEKGDTILLAEDFGMDEPARFHNSLNITKTSLGMQSTCRARTQLFLIDSCREMPSAILDNLTLSSARVFADARVGVHQPIDCPIIYASAPYSRAYGKQNEKSRFADALLQTLSKGFCSTKRNSRWQIDSSSLFQGIRHIMDQMNLMPGVPSQNCRFGGEMSGKGIIHVLPESIQPEVFVSIKLDPHQALACATFNLTNGHYRYERAVPHTSPWRPEGVKAGLYTLESHFSSMSFNYERWENLAVSPPSFDETYQARVS